MSDPGPHVFLLVIKLDVRITDVEMNAVKWIQNNLGEEVMRFTLVLFTGADKLEKPVEEFLQENIKLKEVLDEFAAGYHTFTNMTKNDGAQVSELVKKMKTLVTKNREEHYTEEMYLVTQRKISEEMKKHEEAVQRVNEEERKRQSPERNSKNGLYKIIMISIILAGIVIGV
ncbi:GTPase IMAP family member 3-like isoform X3 [Triplophysa rosa]|uniref:GTPase IMAP family member 3-like isoform X3 n=1 Tax=Triplophysa rosa TaxID=992332 RepID=UPI002545E12F|nr:GTPase IMAP family member 3-like isoform X3 [Triplophysa rosa]